MEKTPKMTKATAFAIALEVLEQSAHPDKEQAIAKIAKEIENLSKKNGNSGKPTKAQIENAQTASAMVEWMKMGHHYSVTDLSKSCPAVLGLNSQKIRPMLTTLIKQGLVERTEEKGKAIFTKIAEPAEVVEDEE